MLFAFATRRTILYTKDLGDRDVLAQAGKVYVFNAWKCNTNFDLNQSACMRVPLPDDTHTVVQPSGSPRGVNAHLALQSRLRLPPCHVSV